LLRNIIVYYIGLNMGKIMLSAFPVLERPHCRTMPHSHAHPVRFWWVIELGLEKHPIGTLTLGAMIQTKSSSVELDGLRLFATGRFVETHSAEVSLAPIRGFRST
jgi:hypothetical protein